MSLSQTLAPVVDLVFPPRCPTCGDAIAAQTGLCIACWSELEIPSDPACTLCGRPFLDSVRDGATCAPCLANPPRHDGIAAATLYNETSRKLVLAFKHGNRIALAPMMARLMTAKLGFLDETWVIVPVPLHRWRLWRRGYNQAAVLAREIAKKSKARLSLDALRRTRATPSLGGLGAKARRKALSGAIAIHPARKAGIKGAKILLVDDVLTSGATSDACVKALKAAGAQEVKIACFARVMGEAL
ncbi:MAG: ComF family protein [Sphingomonadaceae bacterium]